MPVHNAEIASIFDQTAELLEIKGDSQFRVRAYRRAARTIESLPHSVTSMLAAGKKLSDLPGIGKDLAGKIAQIAETGRFDVLDSLKHQLPGDLGAMAAIPGLGPKRIKLLYDKLHIRTIDDLQHAAAVGKLRDTPGLGAAVEKRILVALAKPHQEKRFKLSVAEAEAEALVALLSEGLKDGHVTVAGSYRRRRDTVADLDVLVTAHNGGTIGAKLVSYDNVAEILLHGPTRTAVVLRCGMQVDLRVVAEESYGAALLYFTGSKAHNIALRTLAAARGWKLNEYGLFAGNRQTAGATEADVYHKLGLAFIPPEMREDRGEIALARQGRLPILLSLNEIRGDLHLHSDWSDGTAAIAQMAEAAKARGYEYIAITDHSKHLTIAHGLDRARLSRQIDEIDRLNDKLDGITVLKGIEVDILTDGTLDLPDEILSRLDVVIAAIHSNFDLSQSAQTERILNAMDNRRVSIIAHPTGRLIGQRDPYVFDVDRVFATAAEVGCHLEINAEPDRLDLDDLQVRAAKAAGVKLAISTDAHLPGSLAFMRYGVDQARRGWLTADDVINTRPVEELKRLLKR